MGFFQALMCSVGFCPGGILALIFLLFISCHEKKQNKHKPLACQHQREKKYLQQLYHNRSKQAASDFPVKSTRKKKEKKSFQRQPLKNFSLLFLSLFLLQKGIYHRGFQYRLQRGSFSCLFDLQKIKDKKSSNQDKKLALISEGSSSFQLLK